jgi:hypothetical protein
MLARAGAEFPWPRVRETLRSFFRHAEVRSWCTVGLASSIDGPRVLDNRIVRDWAIVIVS